MDRPDVAAADRRRSAERVAKNDDTFRQANEEIRDSAEEYELRGRIPFICECADLTCTDLVLLTRREYGGVRSRSTTFFNVPGHEQPFLHALKVVDELPTYVVVEKIGRAAEVVAELEGKDIEEIAGSD